jgi:hypothetical protein
VIRVSILVVFPRKITGAQKENTADKNADECDYKSDPLFHWCKDEGFRLFPQKAVFLINYSCNDQDLPVGIDIHKFFHSRASSGADQNTGKDRFS